MAGDWIECALADACNSIDYGLTASASEHAIGPRFLRITDIVTGHIDWSAVPHVAADDATAAKYRLHDGDIVLARTGASTGASAYVKDPPPAVFASYLVRLQANPQFDARFLAYYLRSDAFWTFIRGVLGDKSAQPNASASTMTKAPLRAPKDKDEQRAIAHILGTLDDKIELNRRMSETLEAMARALFKSWFVDFDPVRAKAEGRDPGLPKPLADLFPARLVDSELGEIPEGWEVVPFEALASIRGGKQLPTEDCMPSGSFPVFGANGVMGFTDQATHDGFVIAFGRVGAYCGSVHWTYGGAWINNNASSVVPARWPEYVLQVMLEADFEGLRRGSAQPFIPNSSLAGIPVVRPPDSVLDAFSSLAAPLRLREQACQGESRALAALRDTLLPKLISGELRVEDAEKFIGRAD